jgi:copper chaperone
METIVMNVQGMTCGGCANGVKRALVGVNGVADSAVDLAGGKATVQYDAAKATPVHLKSTIENASFAVAD